MGKVEDSQHAKSEGEARGDQKEEGRPGNSTHELTEKDVKRHTLIPQTQMSKSKCQMKHILNFELWHLTLPYLTTPVFFQISLTLASGRMTWSPGTLVMSFQILNG